MEPYYDPTTIGIEGVPPVTLRRRKFNVEINNIPAVIKNKLMTDRYVEVTWAQVKNYIRNRMTGATE